MKSFIYTIFLLWSFAFKLLGYEFNIETSFNSKDLNENELLSLNPIKFAFVRIGNSKNKYLSITNAGTNIIKVKKIYFLKNGLGSFYFSAIPTPPAFIQPNEKISINLIFQPPSVNAFYDTLIVEFSEPFTFFYEVPIEGYSFLYDTLSIVDTSAFIGTKNLKLPLILAGVANLEESLICDISFDLVIDHSLLTLENENTLPIVSKIVNNTTIIYHFLIPNVTIDQSPKVLTDIFATVLLSPKRTTKIELNNISTNLEGINIVPKNGNFEAFAICLTDYSMIEMGSQITGIDIYPNPISDFLNVSLKSWVSNTSNTPHKIHICIMNLYGSKIFEVVEETTQRNLELDLSNIPTGLYNLIVQVEHQQYSKIISVYK